MIHIVKNKKNEFAVAVVADNGELLSMSEGLSSKQKAKKNIESMCRVFNSGSELIDVLDNTVKGKAIALSYVTTGIERWVNFGRTDHNKYIPGKNPKRKSAGKKK